MTVDKLFPKIPILFLFFALLVCSLQAAPLKIKPRKKIDSQNIYIPEKIREYLISNERMGVKPSKYSEMFPDRNAVTRIFSKNARTISSVKDTSVFDTIFAVKYGNGSMTPQGTILVNYGSNAEFMMYGNIDESPDSVLVDGVNTGTDEGYVFYNVTGNHTIAAYFSGTSTVPQDTIFASVHGVGSLTPAGTILVDTGGTIVFSARFYVGGKIDSLVVDGVNMGINSDYAFTDVTTNHTIDVYFGTVPVETIVADEYGDGTITPLGTVLVDSGEAVTFQIASYAENIIDSVVVDGSAIEKTNSYVESYTFNAIDANHTITAYFSVDTTLGIDSTSFTDSHISFPPVIAGYTKWIDYNNDGQLDAVIMGVTGPTQADFTAKIFQNSGGTFTDINAALNAVSNQQSVAWGDYDNDGNLDLFISGATDQKGLNPVATLYHNVNGTFVADTVNHFIGLIGSSANWVDYDNDGQPDLFYTGATDVGYNFRSLLYHNDNGIFTLVENTPFVAVWGTASEWADYDNDGDMDLLITGYGGTAYSKIYRNDGNGVFTDINAPLQAVNSGAVKWFDFDNDGDLDILLTGVAPGNVPTAKIYRNDGNDTFVDIHADLKPVSVSAVAVGDFDNDGFLDVAISGSESFFVSTNLTTKIYRNDGNGHFHDLHAKLPGSYFGDLSWGDYDADGKLDLLVSGGYYGSSTPNDDPPQPFTFLYHNNASHSSAAPTVPSSLTVIGGVHAARLQWGGATDGKTPAKGLSYNIRVGTTPGGIGVFSPGSHLQSGNRRFPIGGNASRRTTFTMKNIKPGKYYYSVQSVNNAYRGSHFSEVQSFIVLPTSQWYLVSAPVAASGDVFSFYPKAATAAWSYDNGYHQTQTLQHGLGYWLRLQPISALTISGAPVMRERDTISLKPGWNLIGSVSGSVAVTSLVTDPPNILNTKVFGYHKGYVLTTTIDPLQGYWVKAKSAGTVILSSSGAVAPKSSPAETESFASITIGDGDGGSQSLYFGNDNGDKRIADDYIMPPHSPAGDFDARFGNGTMLETAKDGMTRTVPVQITSSAYPVTITWNNVTLKEASLQIGTKTVALSGSGSVQVTDDASPVSLTFAGEVAKPKSFMLSQNYPNPFNPATTIRYQLPQDAKVVLKVYNLLGQEVATLVNEMQTAGYKQVRLDMSNYGSGVYFYRINAGEFSAMEKMVFIK